MKHYIFDTAVQFMAGQVEYRLPVHRSPRMCQCVVSQIFDSLQILLRYVYLASVQKVVSSGTVDPCSIILITVLSTILANRNLL